MDNPASSPILLPVDGSESAARAARHCAAMAKALGARVIVLNVQPAIEDWQTHGLGRSAAENHLAALAEAALKGPLAVLAEGGIECDSLVRFGDAPNVIAGVVVERHCASIVMGTRGQSELKSFIMGGVGMKVIHLVKVPVTFVH
jgi:nucleotide-binding universal stress UspA family protein